MLRLSYAKVSEFQARGLVHFHTVIRMDGPDAAPPAWATVPVLDAAITAAARAVALPVPGDAEHGHRDRVLRCGDQLDIRPIEVGETNPDGPPVTEDQVSRYVGKYAIKGAENAGTVDRPIRSLVQLATAPGLTPDARRMIETCWRLHTVPTYADLGLRRWAHMLGYRGHFSTKSRRYSTTLGAIQTACAEYQADQARQRARIAVAPGMSIAKLGEWQFAGAGYFHAGEAEWAETIRVQAPPPACPGT